MRVYFSHEYKMAVYKRADDKELDDARERLIKELDVKIFASL